MHRFPSSTSLLHNSQATRLVALRGRSQPPSIPSADLTRRSCMSCIVIPLSFCSKSFTCMYIPRVAPLLVHLRCVPFRTLQRTTKRRPPAPSASPFLTPSISEKTYPTGIARQEEQNPPSNAPSLTFPIHQTPPAPRDAASPPPSSTERRFPTPEPHQTNTQAGRNDRRSWRNAHAS